MLNEWKTAFQKIYSDGHDTATYDEEHLQYVTSQNEENAHEIVHAPSLNKEISIKEVKDAIVRAKLRKAAGIDGIKAEVLKNNASITLLHKICNLCFMTGQVPSCWNQSVISPIPKESSKNALLPGNYRGIALISVPCKIYCDILNKRMSKWLEENSELVDEQNGYRKDRNCIDQLYVLNSIIEKRIKSKQNTFVSFIDMRKAFDNVNHQCLWFKLQKCGIGGHMLKAIQSLYQNVSYSVKVNGHLTPWFNITKGVKQGCTLSPTLFQVYINGGFENYELWYRSWK